MDPDRPADIDLLVLCSNDEQTDQLRLAIDPDVCLLPLHIALMTYEEAAECDAGCRQNSHAIFP